MKNKNLEEKIRQEGQEIRKRERYSHLCKRRETLVSAMTELTRIENELRTQYEVNIASKQMTIDFSLSHRDIYRRLREIPEQLNELSSIVKEITEELHSLYPPERFVFIDEFAGLPIDLWSSYKAAPIKK